MYINSTSFTQLVTRIREDISSPEKNVEMDIPTFVAISLHFFQFSNLTDQLFGFGY